MHIGRHADRFFCIARTVELGGDNVLERIGIARFDVIVVQCLDGFLQTGKKGVITRGEVAEFED